MSSHFHHVREGSPFGIRWTFDNAGDALPMHKHPPAEEHSILCLRGAVKVVGPAVHEAVLLREGEILEFDSGELHQVVAVLDDTVIVNLFDRGMPAHYAHLPPSELEGSIELRLE